MSPSLDIFCLADGEVNDDQKEEVAKSLLQVKKTSDVGQFPPGDGKIIVPGPDFVNNSDYWAPDGSLPGLQLFVGRESWLLFHYLGITEQAEQWLEDKAANWNTYESFRKFEQFVTKLISVNDPAERTVKLAQDFISNVKDENYLQNKYLVVAEHRKVVKSTKSGKKTKSSLKRMGGL